MVSCFLEVCVCCITLGSSPLLILFQTGFCSLQMFERELITSRTEIHWEYRLDWDNTEPSFATFQIPAIGSLVCCVLYHGSADIFKRVKQHQ